MKQVIFRYGMYATMTIVALSAIHFFLIMPNVSWDGGEIAGYLTMILSMIFVFMGIRYYRDHVNRGSLSFGEGMKVGVLIVLIPAVFFGIFDILYTEVINPSWLDNYYSHYAERIKASAPPDKVEEKLTDLQKQKDIFSNPILQFLIMTATVFIIGLIATIISALALRRSKIATAV
jgi:Protein of unknown function (DUF4199)